MKAIVGGTLPFGSFVRIFYLTLGLEEGTKMGRKRGREVGRLLFECSRALKTLLRWLTKCLLDVFLT